MAIMDFERKPWMNYAAIAAGLLIIIWGLNSFLYAPKFRDIKVYRNDLKLVNQELMIISGKTKLNDKELLEAKRVLQQELEELGKRIPTEKETPYLMNNFINKVGKGLNIDYKLIQPMGIISENRYKKIPIKVEFTSSYYSFNKYLEQLKKLPATIRIDNLDLFKSDQYNRVSVRMALSAFVVPGGTLPPQTKEKVDLTTFYDPFYPKAVSTTTKTKKVYNPLAGLKYSGFLEGTRKRAIINDIPLAAGETVSGFVLVRIEKDKVVLKKSGKLYTLRIQ